MKKKSEELNAFKKIKKIYKYFVKEYRTLEPKLMLCEKEDFNLVENALKNYELMKQKKNQLLEDLFLMEALVVGHQEYLESIGKLKEGKKFVTKFMEEIQNKGLQKVMGK